MTVQPSSITDLIIQGVNTYLTNLLMDQVSKDDPTRAGIVREGPLQDDPTKYRVNIMTYPNDPDNPSEWVSEVTPANNNPPYGTPQTTTYEIGGGEMWFERFTTTLDLFWAQDVTRDVALRQASVVMARVRSGLRRMPMPFVDDFGEQSLDLRTMKHEIVPSGGPGSFIYHCKVWFQCLCEAQ